MVGIENFFVVISPVLYVISAFIIGMIFFYRNKDDQEDRKLKIKRDKILGVCFWIQGVSLLFLMKVM